MTTTDDSKSDIADKLSLSEKVVRKAKEELIIYAFRESSSDLTAWMEEYDKDASEHKNCELYVEYNQVKSLIEEIERLKKENKSILDTNEELWDKWTKSEKENQELKKSIAYLRTSIWKLKNKGKTNKNRRDFIKKNPNYVTERKEYIGKSLCPKCKEIGYLYLLKIKNNSTRRESEFKKFVHRMKGKEIRSCTIMIKSLRESGDDIRKSASKMSRTSSDRKNDKKVKK